MTPQEMIDVIQAHADGKQIEMRRQDESSDWCWIAAPVWNFSLWDYRVKQPAALRPHWPVLAHDTQLDIYLVEDVLFPTVEEAREFYPNRLRVIRLATEYPPVMLP